jgi:ribosome-associated protein
MRYDIHASGMPKAAKERLLTSGDSRISSDGVLVIKAQGSRSQEQNKLEAMASRPLKYQSTAPGPSTRMAGLIDQG